MTKPKLTPEIGDLVEVGEPWNMRGIVLADDSVWWCANNHFDVSHCIVNKKDIVRIVEPRAVRPDLVPYLQQHGVRNG